MGSINFNNLKNTNLSQKNNVFTDIFLDLAQEPFEYLIGNRTIQGNSRDIKVAYDLNAIKNSLVNLFNTVPGERFLLPDYGCDLRQYVFEPVNEFVARRIGRDIVRNLEKWEPRVKLVNISVDGYKERGEYEITLKLDVPFLRRNEPLSLTGLLSRQGFRI
jgi:phage baseplate assembly protein W